jgi:hypothetical protein
VAFARAVKTVGARQVEKLVLTAEEFGARYRTWAPAEQQYVPLLTTWLNQERWTTVLPEANRGRGRTTVDVARSAAQILADRRSAREGVEQKAVSA